MARCNEIEINEIPNFYAICEVIIYDDSFRNLGDLLLLLAMSAQPRHAKDPLLLFSVLKIIETLMIDLEFLVFLGPVYTELPCQSFQEVASHLHNHWDNCSTKQRKNLLFFARS